jgi:Flp pilus assembly pilin Flp
VRRPLAGQSGQGMVEYGFILVLVALVVVASLLALGNAIPTIFNNVVDKLKNA